MAKLPWEKKETLSIVDKVKKEEYHENLQIEDEMKEGTNEYYENLKIEEELTDTNIDMKDEVKLETNNDIKDEGKETFKLQGIRLCDSMKEGTLEIGQENKDDFPSNQSYPKAKRLFEKFKVCAVENKG